MRSSWGVLMVIARPPFFFFVEAKEESYHDRLMDARLAKAPAAGLRAGVRTSPDVHLLFVCVVFAAHKNKKL